jgi:hypothetical protein
MRLRIGAMQPSWSLRRRGETEVYGTARSPCDTSAEFYLPGAGIPISFNRISYLY